MSTNSTLIREWEDAPEDGRSADEWPYPTQYSQSLITGDLADAVRARLGLDSHVPVLITEQVVSGGWSEWTQENDYNHTITAGEHAVEIGGSFSGNNAIRSLTDWLDQTATEGK